MFWVATGCSERRRLLIPGFEEKFVFLKWDVDANDLDDSLGGGEIGDGRLLKTEPLISQSLGGKRTRPSRFICGTDIQTT